MYWTWNVGKDATNSELEHLRRLLAPHAALQDEELRKAREEAKRIENAILVLKMRIQNHPNAKSFGAAAHAQTKGDLSSSIDQPQLELDIRKIEQEIVKYSSVAKALLEDVADVYGVAPKTVLDRLAATRSVQRLLL